MSSFSLEFSLIIAIDIFRGWPCSYYETWSYVHCSGFIILWASWTDRTDWLQPSFVGRFNFQNLNSIEIWLDNYHEHHHQLPNNLIMSRICPVYIIIFLLINIGWIPESESWEFLINRNVCASVHWRVE